MKFYRYTGKDDLWLGKCGKSDRTLIPNELLTTAELNSIKSKCPRLNMSKFKEIDIPKSNTYTNFGVRFEDDTDHNTKFESKNRYCRTHINESYFNSADDVRSMLRILQRITNDFLKGDVGTIPELTISFNNKFLTIPMDVPEFNNEFEYFLEGLMDAYSEIDG